MENKIACDLRTRTTAVYLVAVGIGEGVQES